jgi:hypothetical protein
MKQKTTNSTTRSKSAGHNGSAGNDTNPLKKFEAILCFTQHNSATVIIEAQSLEEAEDKADEISTEDVDWDGDAVTGSVRQSGCV